MQLEIHQFTSFALDVQGNKQTVDGFQNNN